MDLPASIFKAYDVRGVVDQTLTESGVAAIGRAFGDMAIAKGATQVVVGRDGRLSGSRLSAALVQGLCRSGLDVIDIGQVVTPLVYFGAHEFSLGTGIQLTGSHNPPQYNGLKMMVAGETLYGPTIQALYHAIKAPGFDTTTSKLGKVQTAGIWPAYLEKICGDVHLKRPVKLVVDAGNGVAGAFAGPLLRALGCEVIELFCEVDGTFPNHHPDPAHPENLQDLIACVQHHNAELGLAFDGDGDRLGVVTKGGQIIYPDRQLMLFARDILTRTPGATVIYDVKCSRLVGQVIKDSGGQPLMWKTGHSLIKAKLQETGAVLAGEMSGHIFFKERWYGFDDGLYAAVRLLEIISAADDASAVLNALPNSLNTPELHLPMAEGESFKLIERLQAEADFPEALNISTIDGVRVEYADGFGLVRASNTTPVLVMRFEADSKQALERIQMLFKRVILQIKPDVVFAF